MTMSVKRNMVSASDSHQVMSGRPFSPIMPSAIAKMMLKTTICRTSPRAMASMTDSGTVCRSTWSHVCAVAATSVAAAGSEIPSPGRVTFTATRPMRSAIVVTASK